jgi:hypothetical protein
MYDLNDRGEITGGMLDANDKIRCAGGATSWQSQSVTETTKPSPSTETNPPSPATTGNANVSKQQRRIPSPYGAALRKLPHRFKEMTTALNLFIASENIFMNVKARAALIGHLSTSNFLETGNDARG